MNQQDEFSKQAREGRTRILSFVNKGDDYEFFRCGTMSIEDSERAILELSKEGWRRLAGEAHDWYEDTHPVYDESTGPDDIWFS